MSQLSSIAHTLHSAITRLVDQKLARTLTGTALSVCAGLGLLLLAFAGPARHTGSEYIVIVGLFWVSIGLLGVVSHLSAARTPSPRARKTATKRRTKLERAR